MRHVDTMVHGRVKSARATLLFRLTRRSPKAEKMRKIQACPAGNDRAERRRRTMLRALGYAGFGSADLDDWRQFGTGLVGLQAVERSPSQLSFRMDDRKQRIVIDRAMGDGARFFGWEVADGAALDALAARLESAGVAVTAEPQTLADNRRVRGLISFADPAGSRLGA